ncbi:MAG: hypothetical protein GY767_04500, partial [Shimia sp.]|nr:hypothetical protein [Shimia sp.]
MNIIAGAADTASSKTCQLRRLKDLFIVDEHGQIVEILKADGTVSSEADREADAKQWAAHFADDVFNNHCVNHEHDCTETCIKYAKKRLEAKQSLRSHKVPSCRFGFFRVKSIGGKMRRRRGKPLVDTAHIADTDERNQEFRCQVRREQPFRSTSNDVAQVTDRCNVDFQFLFCAPPLPAEDARLAPRTTGEHSSASQPAAPAGSETAPRPKRTRLMQKTPDVRQRAALVTRPRRRPAWFPATATLSQSEHACIEGFAASFQKAAAMDFYITKYQGKPMESLTPLFMSMSSGIHRLEKQEEQEEAEANAARLAVEADGDAAEPAPKRRKTIEDLSRRARRITIRLASMANRCFWVSAAELVVHILTDGDCLQSHNNMRLFTRQLQWAMQQCKKHLNHEAVEEASEKAHHSVQAVSVHVIGRGE